MSSSNGLGRIGLISMKNSWCIKEQGFLELNIERVGNDFVEKLIFTLRHIASSKAYLKFKELQPKIFCTCLTMQLYIDYHRGKISNGYIIEKQKYDQL